MYKIIKLFKTSIKHNRTYKIIRVLQGNNINNKLKLGSIEYKKTKQQLLFLNINAFKMDFIKGVNIKSDKFLKIIKYSGVLSTPWSDLMSFPRKSS
jgi:hypothetical protein